MCQFCLSWYARCVAPYLVTIGCSTNAFMHMRRRMIPRAEGIVVEVGIGSGLNLPFYSAAKVERLFGVDPDGTMLGDGGPGWSRSAIGCRMYPSTRRKPAVCRWMGRYSCCHLHVVYHTGARSRPGRNPACPEALGSAALSRTWSGRSAVLPPMARAIEQALVGAGRRLQPHSGSAPVDSQRRVSNRRT